MTGHVYFDYTEGEKGTHGAVDIELCDVGYEDKVHLMAQLIEGLQMGPMEFLLVTKAALEEAYNEG